MGRLVTGSGSSTKSAPAGIPTGSTILNNRSTLCSLTGKKSARFVCIAVKPPNANEYIGKSKMDLQDIELRLLGEIANLKTDSRRARQKLESTRSCLAAAKYDLEQVEAAPRLSWGAATGRTR